MVEPVEFTGALFYTVNAVIFCQPADSVDQG